MLVHQESLISLLIVGSVLVSSCSAPERPAFSGKPYSELASYAEANGIEISLADDCKIRLSIDEFDQNVLPQHTDWTPSEPLPEEVLNSLIVSNPQWISDQAISYCATLDVQAMPAMTPQSPGIKDARQLCLDIEGVVSREASGLTAGELDESIGVAWKTNRLLDVNPRYMGLERYYFYAFNLYDYAQGLGKYLAQKPVFSGGSSSDVDVDNLSMQSLLNRLNSGSDLHRSLSRAIRLLDGASVEAKRLCGEISEAARANGLASNEITGSRENRPTCQKGGACSIGDIGPGGGTIFYDAGERQDWGRYLEAAPQGWSGDRRDPRRWWCGKDNAKNRRSVKDLNTQTKIGAGATNTQKILEACGFENAAGEAAFGRIGGLSDWFLPSRDELAELARMRYAAGIQLNAFPSPTYQSSSVAKLADYPDKLFVWVWDDERKNLAKQSGFYALGSEIRPIRAF